MVITSYHFGRFKESPREKHLENPAELDLDLDLDLDLNLDTLAQHELLPFTSFCFLLLFLYIFYRFCDESVKKVYQFI